jgi:hypothetical protein
MNQDERMSDAIAELHQGRAGLGREAEQYAVLSQEVSALRMRAQSDPEARAKLARLDHMMKNGGYQLQARIEQTAARLDACFKQLAGQMQNVAPPEVQQQPRADAVVPRATSKKRSRSFI